MTKKVIFLLTVALLLMSFITIPPAPRYVDYDVDSSFGVVLTYAHQHGLQYGPDLVFTYGPLGFLSFWFFSPHLAGLRMVIDVALGTTVALGLCLVAWRLRMVWRCSLLGLFFWVGGNTWPRTDLVINTGLICWGLLCFVESGRRLTFSVMTFIALGVFIALAKNSFLVVAGVSTVLVACDLVTRGHWRLAAAALVGSAGGFLAGWVIAGQNPLHLVDFVMNSFAMIQGYSQAMGMEGLESVRHAGWVLALLLLPMILARALSAFENRDRELRWRRVWLSLWVIFFAFTIWKHGWVRVDSFHVVMFLGFIPVLALALEILPSQNLLAKSAARGLAVTGCLVAIFTVQTFYFPPLPRSLVQPFRTCGDHLRCLLKPGEYRARMNEVIEGRRRECQLPRLREIVGQARTDVFGQYAVYALFNDLNYAPRPVFQSYAACNARLMILNEQFYLSDGRPEFVLFSLSAMDKRMPALEDARVLRQLLINYAPVAAEGIFLLLQARSSDPPKLALLKEDVVEAGQTIDLKPYGDADLWLEIDLKLNWIGRLRQLLYRPPLVRLAAWREAGRDLLIRHRAPASMLAAGFLASPLLLNNNDVLDFYAGSEIRRPSAYSVAALPEDRRYCKKDVRYRVYRIEHRLDANIDARMASRLRAARLLAEVANSPSNSESMSLDSGANGHHQPIRVNSQPPTAP